MESKDTVLHRLVPTSNQRKVRIKFATYGLARLLPRSSEPCKGGHSIQVSRIIIYNDKDME